MNTHCPPKRVPSAARFFTLCRLTMQPPQSYSVEDNAALGSLQASPQAPGQTTGVAGARASALDSEYRDTGSKAALLLAVEPKDPKCFTESLRDLTCFWDESLPPEGLLNHTFHYRYDCEWLWVAAVLTSCLVDVLVSPDLDPLILALSLILLLIMTVLSITVFLSHRRFLLKKMWPPIPSPESTFGGLFTVHRGNFQCVTLKKPQLAEPSAERSVTSNANTMELHSTVMFPCLPAKILLTRDVLKEHAVCACGV
ncbi:UNVERIFIED_CONTAM: hypothetical protein FKN15_061926 [Acipenser sinensis]